MTLHTPAMFIQSQEHPAADFRLLTQAVLGAPTGLYVGGIGQTDPGHGVAGPSDMYVTANGTPNKTVHVAAGGAFVRGTEASTQGVYHAYNDGDVTLTRADADATNPRWDVVGVQIRDGNYSGTDYDARLVIITGTPGASPGYPTLPPNFLPLARVVVAANDNTTAQADILDLRGLAGSGPPVGSLLDYAGAAAPAGWLLCYGQAVSRTSYARLFAVLGTTFGTGDGSSTFNVPDLRGRTVAGLDNMGGVDAARLTWANAVGTVGGGQAGSHAHYEGDLRAAIGAGNGNTDLILYEAGALSTRGPTHAAAYSVSGTGYNVDIPFNHHTRVYGAVEATTVDTMQPTMLLNKIIRT